MIDTLQDVSEFQVVPASQSAGANAAPPADDFVPREPDSLEAAGLGKELVESLVLKFLLNNVSASGRRMSDQIRLPYRVIHEILQGLKSQLLVGYKGSAAMSDYEYELTSTGLERARRYNEQCTYYGAAPVPLADYTAGVSRQSIRDQKPRLADLMQAFSDLLLPPSVVSQVGQAVYAGKGLFLYGAPGSGKTSIAERVAKSLNKPVWIPRTVSVSGELIRLFDSSNHEELPLPQSSPLHEARFDRRWVRIRRPTIVAGGELSLANLEFTNNASTGINESPLQMKSNGGVLVIDDFGRQRIGVAEMLNRWIVPLEKGFDILRLSSGRQIQVPIDQLLVFATNMEPKQLIDEAFLRRICYKIEMTDPCEATFRDLFKLYAPRFGFEYNEQAVSHLIEKHFTSKGRSFRYCHPRDLLQQAKTFCDFYERPAELTAETFDAAAVNYFAGL